MTKLTYSRAYDPVWYAISSGTRTSSSRFSSPAAPAASTTCRASAESAGASAIAPTRRRVRPCAHAGSATSRRPTRNAWLFIGTETPLSTIASSIAVALTGIAPACQAAPSTIMLAAMWSSKSISAKPSASR